MDNSLVNAVVAMVENRPEDAKSMLHDSVVGRKSPTYAIQNRLYASLDKRDRAYAAYVVRGILMKSLRIQPPEEMNADAFFHGVKAVEDEIEAALKDLTTE